MPIINIDGKECEFVDGEYILEISRKNNIFIPSICYLSGCSPTLACRLCMVEVDGKRVYSCNAKAKDGMHVITENEELAHERNAIMQTYCANHPLQCGVCDKCGECELQEFVHHTSVNEQNFTVKDSFKKDRDWNFIKYEPSLCIVCERCITVCKDKIGEAALKTIPRGAEPLDKSLKDVVPKEAFAVWNKFMKSIIGPASGDTLDCSMCGECTSVCPTGAIIGKKFQYTSNAWELEKIPASNPHSSDCELIYYDVKQSTIEDRREKIFRVSNDRDYGEISTAARYGFDFNKDISTKNKEVFSQIVNKIKNGDIKTIKFNSFITNEEAKILSLLKEKYNLKLVNNEAKVYKDFMNEFVSYAGETLYNGDYDAISDSQVIITAGTFLRSDAPNVGFKINNALKIKKAVGIYFHPLKDKIVETYSKNFISCNHKENLDVEILLWILQKFSDNLPAWLKEKLNSEFTNSKKTQIVPKKTFVDEIVKKTIKDENGNDKEVEETVKKEVTVNEEVQIDVKTSNFASKLGFDEDKVNAMLNNKEKIILIIGEDFIVSKNAKTLAKLSGMIQKYTNIKVMIIPPRTNSLGVSMICDLDDKEEGQVLGYNEKADIVFGCSEAHLDAPALNEQEGTFTNLDKRVVPTNPALKYLGYELNDIACELGVYSENTIDYTSKLGKSFKNIEFDDLENYYKNGGENCRGYKLESEKINSKDEEFDISNQSEELSGIIIYKANPIHQFSKFTNLASQLHEVAQLYAGEQFLTDNSLNENDLIDVKYKDKSIVLRVKKDKNIEGAYLPFFDDKLDIDSFFESRFNVFSIEKVEK